MMVGFHCAGLPAQDNDAFARCCVSTAQHCRHSVSQKPRRTPSSMLNFAMTVTASPTLRRTCSATRLANSARRAVSLRSPTGQFTITGPALSGFLQFPRTCDSLVDVRRRREAFLRLVSRAAIVRPVSIELIWIKRARPDAQLVTVARLLSGPRAPRGRHSEAED